MLRAGLIGGLIGGVVFSRVLPFVFGFIIFGLGSLALYGPSVVISPGFCLGILAMAVWPASGFIAARLGAKSLGTRLRAAGAGAISGGISVIVGFGLFIMIDILLLRGSEGAPRVLLQAASDFLRITLLMVIIAAFLGAIGGASGWRRPPQATPEKEAKP